MGSRERSVGSAAPPFLQWVHRRSGVVWLLHSEVVASSSLSSWRHELRVAQQMRRLPAWLVVHFDLLGGVIEIEAAEAGFEMNIRVFPVKGSKGSEGSKCLYSGRVLGS